MVLNENDSPRGRKGQGKKKSKRIPDDDQPGFINKTFGLFSIIILFQLVYVLIIYQDPEFRSKNHKIMEAGPR